MIRYYLYIAWEAFKLIVTVAVGVFVLWLVTGCASPYERPPAPKVCHIVIMDNQGHGECVSRSGFERWKERNGYGDQYL